VPRSQPPPRPRARRSFRHSGARAAAERFDEHSSAIELLANYVRDLAEDDERLLQLGALAVTAESSCLAQLPSTHSANSRVPPSTNAPRFSAGSATSLATMRSPERESSVSATPAALSAIPIAASGVGVDMSCSAFTSVGARRTDGPQTNACRHCGSRNTHWFSPPEASDEGAILLCGRCSRVTTILVADGRIVRAWPSRSAGHAA